MFCSATSFTLLRHLQITEHCVVVTSRAVGSAALGLDLFLPVRVLVEAVGSVGSARCFPHSPSLALSLSAVVVTDQTSVTVSNVTRLTNQGAMNGAHGVLRETRQDNGRFPLGMTTKRRAGDRPYSVEWRTGRLGSRVGLIGGSEAGGRWRDLRRFFAGCSTTARIQ